MRRSLCTLALLALLATPTPAAAGPWSKGWGELYVKLGESLFLADSYVDASGRVVRGAEYLGATTSLYFEVGIWRGLMAWGYLPYIVAVNSFDDGSSYLQAGGADALVGLQYSPSEALGLPLPLAVRLEFKAPLYDVGQHRDDPLASRYPAPGDGQLDMTLWLSAGGSLPGRPLYFFAEVGYRHRTEAYIGQGDTRAFGDGIALAAQVGYTFRRRMLLAANFNGVVPFSADEVTKGYLVVGPVLAVLMPRGLAIEFTVDPIVWARNASPGVGVSLGLSFKR